MTDQPNAPVPAEVREAVDAKTLFAAYGRYQQLNEAMGEAVLRALGVDYDDIDSWPVSDWWFDDYDDSFELSVQRLDWMPSKEQLAAAFALGFYQCWLNYTDSTEVHATAKVIGNRRPVLHSRTDGEVFRLKARLAALARDGERLAQLAALLADDAFAMTFQTLGQYRSALIRAARRAGEAG